MGGDGLAEAGGVAEETIELRIVGFFVLVLIKDVRISGVLLVDFNKTFIDTVQCLAAPETIRSLIKTISDPKKTTVVLDVPIKRLSRFASHVDHESLPLYSGSLRLSPISLFYMSLACYVVAVLY